MCVDHGNSLARRHYVIVTTGRVRWAVTAYDTGDIPARMATLSIALLGSPNIERDGVAIQVDTRKAIALMAYLAVTRRAHNRDVLAALLWPEHDQICARSSLRRTLSALKKGLGDDVNWLEIERERLALRYYDPGVSIDVHHFHLALLQRLHPGHIAADVCPACLDPLIRA